ncbi:hypothetical protein DPMN_052217 [Dreissena polymorpha]|uniref:Uncharacterized protein n=1 Tax=Dreissena polymorpha TaxID=45954 RepID=A0A9D4HPN8_DREPO|nr:hypothetical protein DPMN_052217 [Dreissena polymorpha]
MRQSQPNNRCKHYLWHIGICVCEIYADMPNAFCDNHGNLHEGGAIHGKQSLATIASPRHKDILHSATAV